MKILFLSIDGINSINDRGIYSDLLRKFDKEGHEVFVVCPSERREGLKTQIIHDTNAKILKVRTGNITKSNIIEKGISTILIETQFKNAIKKYFANETFDLVMYSTPPITFAKVVDYIRKKDGARSYLLLKDIFPQNAVDIGLMSKTGISGFIYQFFRRKEKNLYRASDYIGCMSAANCAYILEHNDYISKETVEVCPNSIEVQDIAFDENEKQAIREKYNIPGDKKVFIYGGNLGKPQGIPFLIECLRSQLTNSEAFFVVVGDGTEFPLLQAFFTKECPSNMILLKKVPRKDYQQLVNSCDIGMIFLDNRFTIPNFPSRLLDYMEASMPIIACTDKNTDIGDIIVNNGFGWFCESDLEVVDCFDSIIKECLEADCETMGHNAKQYLIEEYTVDKSYEIIMKRIG